MFKIRNSFPKIILATVLQMALSSNICWADFSFELQNSFNFTKTNVATENLDKKKFEGTAATTGWRSNKEFTTYLLNGELVYVNTDLHFYAKVAAAYGWLVSGKVIEYPLRWSVDGHENDYEFETGYIMDVCKRFTFIPHAGFAYDKYHTKIRHQHFSHTSPDCYADQSGNKSTTTFYNPYVGIELDFTSRFCDCYDVQFTTTYEIGYVYGRGRNTLPYFFVTDDPNTSRYGNHIKYRDMLSHFFEVTASYSLTKKWQIGIDLAYQTIYNTHKLPFKLQRNKEIVKTGQFTPTQNHQVSDYISQEYSIIFSLVYNISGEGGAYIR